LSSIALQAATNTNVVVRRESSKKNLQEETSKKRERKETGTEKREKESENKNNKLLLPSLCV
jgi:hypothetical protein